MRAMESFLTIAIEIIFAPIPMVAGPCNAWIHARLKRNKLFPGSQVVVTLMTFRLRLLVALVSSLALSSASFALASSTTTKTKTTGHITESARAQKRMVRLRHHRAVRKHVAAKAAPVRHTTRAARVRTAAAVAPAASLRTVSLHTSPRVRRVHGRYVEQFSGHSFSDDNTDGDIVEGEDPIVRQAAIDALGNMNGTVVAIDPTSGRILAMVNQKLALSEGAQPCSTIKVAVALAGLSEKVSARFRLGMVTSVHDGPHQFT